MLKKMTSTKCYYALSAKTFFKSLASALTVELTSVAPASPKDKKKTLKTVLDATLKDLRPVRLILLLSMS